MRGLVAACRKKEACTLKFRTAFKSDYSEPPVCAFKRPDRFSPQLNPVPLQILQRVRADVGAVAARDNIRDPVLHHDGKIRTLVSLAVRCHRPTGIFEAVAVQTVVDRHSVKLFQTRNLRKLVYKAGGQKDFCSEAPAAVIAVKLETVSGRRDSGNFRYLDGDRIVTRQITPGVAQEGGWRLPLTAKETVDRLRGAVALPGFIADQNLPMAPPQNQGGA